MRLERSVIGEEVDLAALYDQWTDDEPSRYCDHDPAALTTAEISVCECGALIDSDTGSEVIRAEIVHEDTANG